MAPTRPSARAAAVARRPASRGALTPRELSQLVQLRRPAAGAALERKRALLARAAGHRLPATRWRALLALHDALLSVRAFPEAHDTWALAGRALARVEAAVRRLPPRERARGADSGVAGTVTRHAFEHGIARWLVRRHAREVDIDWAALDDTAPVDALVRPELVRAEEDAFDGGLLSTREWLALARAGATGESALAWLLHAASATPGAAPVVARLYDSAPLPLTWHLARSGGATTRNALPVARPVVRSGFRRPDADPPRAVAEPLPGIRLLGGRAAQRVIDVARAALAARCREVFAITHANPAEVWWAPLGAGAHLALIGALPADRLSLESNYGYLLTSNGVPVGYGGVTPLHHQANTGINIFEPFRGTEAAFLWTAMLRAFATLFGVSRFVVNAIQFGEDNEEAIASGAYWFYWRLGFRPDDAARRRVAQREARRLARLGAAPTPPARLRHLATGDLVLTLPGRDEAPAFDERWLTTASRLVTTALAGLDPHAHHRAARDVARRVACALEARPSRWPAAEQAAFRRLAPVVALLAPGRWPRADRAALVTLMRAKGRPQERDFVRLAQAHPRFFAALAARCRRG